MTPALLDGLHAAAPRFDGFLLDQYGVLHDGRQPYPGVIDCLGALRDAGKKVLILSNSGKRRQPNIERLARLGIPAALYDDFVTSGEGAHAFLKDRPAALRRGAGNAASEEDLNGRPLRCLTLGGEAEASLLQGLGIDRVEDVAEADFLLLATFGDRLPSEGAFDETLAAARGADLTLVCANPDITGIAGDRFHQAPGALAKAYEQQGGRVIYIGKPHPLIYREALKAIAPVPTKRVLAVGDSLAHDVAGAAGVGVASALIVQGIHREELGDPERTADFDSRLAGLTRRHKASPDFLLRRLAW